MDGIYSTFGHCSQSTECVRMLCVGKNETKVLQIVNLKFKIILDDPLVGSIATQYQTNRAEHDRIAKEWTKRYAT